MDVLEEIQGIGNLTDRIKRKVAKSATNLIYMYRNPKKNLYLTYFKVFLFIRIFFEIIVNIYEYKHTHTYITYYAIIKINNFLKAFQIKFILFLTI